MKMSHVSYAFLIAAIACRFGAFCAAQALPQVEVDRVLDGASYQTMALSRDGRKFISTRLEFRKPDKKYPRGVAWKKSVHDLRTGQEVELPDVYSMYRSALSPDGSVAYLFGQHPMKPELYRIAVGNPNDPPRVILARVDSIIALSPDGKRIAYLLRQGADAQLMVIPSIGGESRQLAAWHAATLAGSVVWSGDGASIAVMLMNGTRRTLQAVSVKSGEISEVVSFESDIPETPFTWPLGDGIYFLRKVPPGTTAQLFLYQRSAKSWHLLPTEGTEFVSSFLQSSNDGSIMGAERVTRPPDPWEKFWQVLTFKTGPYSSTQTVLLRLTR